VVFVGQWRLSIAAYPLDIESVFFAKESSMGPRGNSAQCVMRNLATVVIARALSLLSFVRKLFAYIIFALDATNFWTASIVASS